MELSIISPMYNEEENIEGTVEEIRRVLADYDKPWELILVSDKSVKTALQATVPTYNPAFKAIIQAPILTCIIGILGTSGWYKGRTVTGRGDWFMFDCGIAAEHLALAAAAEGLGTVHVGLFDYAKASQILALPDSRTVVELIPLGYPDWKFLEEQ